MRLSKIFVSPLPDSTFSIVFLRFSPFRYFSPHSSQSSVIDDAQRVSSRTTTVGQCKTVPERHEVNGKTPVRQLIKLSEQKDSLSSGPGVTNKTRSTTPGKTPRSASPAAPLTGTQGQREFPSGLLFTAYDCISATGVRS